jgi:hypothetical protein
VGAGHLAKGALQRTFSLLMTQVYLNHRLECPYCLTIRLRIPADAQPETQIMCDDCGEFLGIWDELLTDFEKQGGNAGVFRLDKGRIRRIN